MSEVIRGVPKKNTPVFEQDGTMKSTIQLLGYPHDELKTSAKPHRLVLEEGSERSPKPHMLAGGTPVDGFFHGKSQRRHGKSHEPPVN